MVQALVVPVRVRLRAVLRGRAAQVLLPPADCNDEVRMRPIEEVSLPVSLKNCLTTDAYDVEHEWTWTDVVTTMACGYRMVRGTSPGFGTKKSQVQILSPRLLSALVHSIVDGG
jgi:hypothetical protein